jgi:hypothetical protein
LLSTAVGQQQPNWCWAAAGAVVMNYINPPPTPSAALSQCSEAQHAYGSPTLNCCTNPGACNKPGEPDFTFYGFTSKTQPPILRWNEIKTQVGCLKKPVAFTSKRADGSAHMMVIVGYATDSQGVALLLINDPLPVNTGQLTWIPYSQYNPMLGDHRVTENYYDVTYGGP